MSRTASATPCEAFFDRTLVTLTRDARQMIDEQRSRVSGHGNTSLELSTVEELSSLVEFSIGVLQRFVAVGIRVAWQDDEDVGVTGLLQKGRPRPGIDKVRHGRSDDGAPCSFYPHVSVNTDPETERIAGPVLLDDLELFESNINK